MELDKIVKYINDKYHLSVSVDELNNCLIVKQNNKCIGECKRTTNNKNKGDLCGRATIDGNDYCNVCLKKNNNKKLKPSKQVDVFNKEEGLFVDNNHFILKNINKLTKVVGIVDFEGKAKPLTKDLILTAQQEGYEVDLTYIK